MPLISALARNMASAYHGVAVPGYMYVFLP